MESFACTAAHLEPDLHDAVERLAAHDRAVLQRAVVAAEVVVCLHRRARRGVAVRQRRRAPLERRRERRGQQERKEGEAHGEEVRSVKAKLEMRGEAWRGEARRQALIFVSPPAWHVPRRFSVACTGLLPLRAALPHVCPQGAALAASSAAFLTVAPALSPRRCRGAAHASRRPARWCVSTCSAPCLAERMSRRRLRRKGHALKEHGFARRQAEAAARCTKHTCGPR